MNAHNQSWRTLSKLKPVFMTELEELASIAARSLEVKRRAALDYLGVDHVLHASYQSRSRHSPDIDQWKLHSSLFDVQLKASIAGRI